MIGNPPFLGGKLLDRQSWATTTCRACATYAGRVPAEADLVCYWFEKAGQADRRPARRHRAGLVATNSIRGGANRAVLDRIVRDGQSAIFEAWADEPWVVDGAAVRVSLVCFRVHGDESVAGIPPRRNRNRRIGTLT